MSCSCRPRAPSAKAGVTIISETRRFSGKPTPTEAEEREGLGESTVTDT